MLGEEWCWGRVVLVASISPLFIFIQASTESCLERADLLSEMHLRDLRTQKSLLSKNEIAAQRVSYCVVELHSLSLSSSLILSFPLSLPLPYPLPPSTLSSPSFYLILSLPLPYPLPPSTLSSPSLYLILSLPLPYPLPPSTLSSPSLYLILPLLLPYPLFPSLPPSTLSSPFFSPVLFPYPSPPHTYIQTLTN